MQPIDYATPASFVPSLIFLAVGVLLVIIGTILAHRTGKVHRSEILPSSGRFGALVLTGMGLLSVGLILFVVGLFSRENTQRAEAQAEIRAAYGLELTDSEIWYLYYPTEAPEEDFEVFGSFEQREQVEGARFVERTIYLVWADDKLQLSESEDGENFSELEPAE